MQFDTEHLLRPDTLELIRAFRKIQDPRVRRQVFELAKAMAERSEKAEAQVGESRTPAA